MANILITDAMVEAATDAIIADGYPSELTHAQARAALEAALAIQPERSGQNTPLGYVRIEAVKALCEEDEVTGVMVHAEERPDSVPVYLASRQPMDVFAAYETWPDDLKAKLSAHDLRRMNGWAPRTNVGDWRIDTSAGGPILVYKNCSVIEGEDARYVLSLIEKDAARQPMVPEPNWCPTCGKHWSDPKAICLDPIHVPAIAHRELAMKETDDGR